MSIFFFLWFLVSAVVTVNAIRRPVPPGRGFPPLWLPGMLVSELAPWLFIVRGLIAWAFVEVGALDSPLGQIGFALFAFAELGLLLLISRTIRAARQAGGPAGPLALLKVYQRLPRGVEKREHVRYWDDLTLDVYRRPETACAPCLIYVHPGSWTRGRPGRTAKPLLYELARAGWVIFDIRYPLSPVATFPDHLIGVKRAVAWAKDAGQTLGVDPSRVAIAGASSGAHLAALAALTWDHRDLQPGFETADTSLIAAAPHYGIYDLLIRNGTRYDWPFIARNVLKVRPQQAPDLYRLGSPIDQVRPDAPPTLVVHGDFDSVVLAGESRHFVAALEAAGAPVRYHEVIGAQHGFDAVASARSRAVGSLVARYLREIAAGVDERRSDGGSSRTYLT